MAINPPLLRIQGKRTRSGLAETFGIFFVLFSLTISLFSRGNTSNNVIFSNTNATQNFGDLQIEGFQWNSIKIAESNKKIAEETLPQIFVLESGGYHDEVTASFLYALRLQTLPITARLFLDRFNSSQLFTKLLDGREIKRQKIDDSWYDFDDKDLTESGPQRLSVQSVIAVTCERDLEKSADFLLEIFEKTNAELLCVVHHGDSRWSTASESYQRAEKWISAKRIQWVTLGSHVTQSLIAESGEDSDKEKLLVPLSLQKSDEEKAYRGNFTLHSAPVRTWSPIFALQSDHTDDIALAKAQENEAPHVIIQGKVEFKRRSYNQIFKEWRKMLSTLAIDIPRPHVRILGKVLLGKDLHLRDGLNETITCYKNLDYLSYYASFEGASAIFPAFSDNDYYINKASSTVAASLITGIPLIASEDLLHAYDYMRPSNVYLRGKGESEVSTFKRIMPSILAQREMMKQNIFHTRDRLLNENEKLIKLWTGQT